MPKLRRLQAAGLWSLPWVFLIGGFLFLYVLTGIGGTPREMFDGLVPIVGVAFLAMWIASRAALWCWIHKDTTGRVILALITVLVEPSFAVLGYIAWAVSFSRGPM